MLVIIAAFILFLDTTVVNVALSTIATELGSEVTDLQWVVDGYTITLATLLLGAGLIVDRVGPLRPLIVGMGLFTLASVLCALAPDMGVLVAARALQGAGAAVVMPSSLALITAMFRDAGARAHAIAWWSATAAVALAAGPVLGAFIVVHDSWRTVFWLNVPFGLAVCLGVGLLPKVPPAASGQRWDVMGQCLLIAGCGLTLWAVIEAPRWGISDVRTLLAGAVGLLCLAGSAWHGTRRPDAIIPTAWVLRTDIAAALAAGFVTFLALYSLIFLVPLLDQQYYGLTPIGTGVACLPLTLAILLTGMVTGWLTNRWSAFGIVTGGLVVMGTGIGIVAAVSLDPGHLLRPFGFVLAGVGSTLALTPATIALMEIAGPTMSGRASALSNFIRNLGAAAGVASAGVLVSLVADTSRIDHDFVEGARVALAVVGTLLVAVAVWIGSTRWRNGDPKERPFESLAVEHAPSEVTHQP